MCNIMGSNLHRVVWCRGMGIAASLGCYPLRQRSLKYTDPDPALYLNTVPDPAFFILPEI